MTFFHACNCTNVTKWICLTDTLTQNTTLSSHTKMKTPIKPINISVARKFQYYFMIFVLLLFMMMIPHIVALFVTFNPYSFLTNKTVSLVLLMMLTWSSITIFLFIYEMVWQGSLTCQSRGNAKYQPTFFLCHSGVGCAWLFPVCNDIVPESNTNIFLQPSKQQYDHLII